MQASSGFKTLVVFVFALAHTSATVATDAVIQQDASSAILAARGFTHSRRSIDLGRSTRLHRARRRRTFDMPKPAGTSGAANSDEENVKLLQKYVEHESEVNRAWQKQANKDILEGKTAILFDEFEDKYEGRPHHKTKYTEDNGDNYGKQSSSKNDSHGKLSLSKSKDDSSDDQCDEPAGERGPTLMDKAREMAKKKTAGVPSIKSKQDQQSDNEDNYGKGISDTTHSDLSGDHKEKKKDDHDNSTSQHTSASKSDAEHQKEQQDAQQQKQNAENAKQKADEEKQHKKQQQQQEKDTEEAKQKEEEKQKKEDQKKEKERQKEEEKQRKEKAKQDKEAQQQKEKEEKQKAREQKEEEKKHKDEHKQNSSGSASGPVAQFLGQTFSGDMTYYDVGLDACGWTDKVEGHTVAVSPDWFDKFSGGDDNPNDNKICGQKIKIYKNGKEVVATITDQCPPCTSGSLDMSESLFEMLENKDVGRCDVKWEFIG